MKFLYYTAKSLLGQNLTLDESVPKELGCAQAVSYVLKAAGCSVPKKGIPGTAGCKDWLDKNAKPLNGPECGAVIVSVTESETRRGHIGICGKYDFMYDNEYSVMSNSSRTGLWDTEWRVSEWKEYYEGKLGLKTFYYKLEV